MSETESVAVAVCTRNRPEMLREALSSLSKLDRAGLILTFLVVENAPEKSVEAMVGKFATSAPDLNWEYVLEDRLGIAFARNCALDLALSRGCDWLAFIDDDETADRLWLKSLMMVARNHRLDLVGGPVRIAPLPEDARYGERLVWAGLSQRFLSKERHSADLAARGSDGQITIITSNWLLDLRFVRRTGIRFDQRLAFSGGEDSAFCRELWKQGGRTGWAPAALVYEKWPRERLTLAYHYRRGRDQAMSRSRQKLDSRGLRAVPELGASTIWRLVVVVTWIVRAIFDGGRSLVRAARTLGAALGTIGAMAGRQSEHYRNTGGY